MRTRAALVLSVLVFSLEAQGAEINAGTASAFLSALSTAQGGDTIRLQPGTYAFNDKIRLNRTFAPGLPVTITAAGSVGSVIFDVDNSEGFFIAGAGWVVEKIWVRCVAGAACEGAAGFSIKETARRITIRNCRTTDWYQHFKASIQPDGTGGGAEDVTIQSCEGFNTAAYAGKSNVINLDGGKRWRVVGNYVHDFANADISYGIYFKGGITDSVMEQNLVICAKERPSGGAALGMSFGGGRMGVQYCAPDNRGVGGCRCEDSGGIARNNIIMHCSDSGFHVNSACGSKIYNNLIYDTSPGLQLQSMQAGVEPIVFTNNIVTGSVPNDPTQLTASTNVVNSDAAAVRAFYQGLEGADLSAGPNAQGLMGATPLSAVSDDYCGAARTAAPFIGPLELPSRCATWPWPSEAAAPPDAGTSPFDAGKPLGGDDAGSSGAVDAGAQADGGVLTLEGINGRCGCQTNPSLLTVGLLMLLAMRGRQRSGRTTSMPHQKSEW